MVDSVVDSVVGSGRKALGAGTTERELNAQHPFRSSKCKLTRGIFFVDDFLIRFSDSGFKVRGAGTTDWELSARLRG